ncbi:MAG: AAA family ATPase [Rhodanobacteraceae bacterium]
MASADQLKALLKSHLNGDDQHFYAVAMQLAAHEAKLGHGQLATELRELVDRAKSERSVAHRASNQPIPIGRPRGELAALLQVSYPKARLADMVLETGLSEQLRRIVLEQRQAAQILAHGLNPRRKLLLMGPPGTGKTMTATVLAGELGLPLCQVRLDGLITKYMGETAAKLRQVFDATERTRGVYFFDEFDAIGSQRGMTNDVGEARRILNSFLQLIEQDQSHSLIVAATNHPDILDLALFRRFDDVLQYQLPDESRIVEMLKTRLTRRTTRGVSWKRLATAAAGLSYADVTRAVDEALKQMLLEKQPKVTERDVRRALDERHRVSEHLGLRLGTT